MENLGDTKTKKLGRGSGVYEMFYVIRLQVHHAEFTQDEREI